MQHLNLNFWIRTKKYTSSAFSWVIFSFKKKLWRILCLQINWVSFFSLIFFWMLIDRMFHFYRVQTEMRTIMNFHHVFFSMFSFVVIVISRVHRFFYEGVHFQTFTKCEWTNAEKYFTRFATMGLFFLSFDAIKHFYPERNYKRLWFFFVHNLRWWNIRH